MSNLLEKASIVTTPTAYDNGKILSVKPALSLGSNLIDYDNITYGSGGWSLVNDKWVFDDATSGYLFVDNLDVEVGQKYQVTVNISISSGDANFRIASGNSQTLLFNYTDFADGETTFETTVTGVDGILERLFAATGLNDNPFTLNSISVNKITEADFDFTRNSSATRVNSQGLIEDVQILSSNLVSNGDFSQEGSELITNGDFATDSDWILSGQNLSISNGQGISTGSNFGAQFKQIILQNNKFYKLTFDIVNYSSGSIGLTANYYGEAAQYNSVGTHTAYFTSLSQTEFRLYSQNFIGSIDNVSVKEVGQDWTILSPWIVGNNVLSIDGSQVSNQYTSQVIPSLTSGNKYKLQYTVSNITAGQFRINVANTLGTYVSSNGTYEFVFNATSGTTLQLQASTTLAASITDISLIEITEDTNLPRINYEGFSYQDSLGSELVTNGDFATDSNWNKINSTISGGTGNLNGTGVTSMLYQNILTNGKTYKVTFTVSDYNSLGEARIIESSGSAIYTITSNGTFTFTFTHSNADGNFLFRARTGAIFSIDNVSVKEYLGQEVVPDSGRGSWLFEPQSTNLITQSENLSNMEIAFGGAITLDSNFINPSGQKGCYFIYDTDGGTQSRFRVSNSGFTLGDKLSYSVFLKSNSSSLITIGGNYGGENCTFNVGTKTLISQGAAVNSYEIINFTNGWTRYIVNTTFTNTVPGNAYPFFTTNATLSEKIYLWGHQLEVQSYATSYIPTNGSAVTRLQDSAFGSGSSDLINSTEGVLYAEISALANVNLQRILSISDGTHNNTIKIGFANSTSVYKIFCDVRVGGVNQVFMSNDFGAVQPTFKKCAVKYKQNDFALWIDGVKVATDTIGNVPTGLNELSFDRGGGAQYFFGETKCVAVFKEALTDAELTCLTTI